MIKHDYAPPIWERTPTLIERFLKTKWRFALYILLIYLGGAEWK